MKYVYFIDESDSSEKNGIGTYRNQFLSGMSSHRAIRTFLIALNSNYKVLSKKTSTIYVPCINGRNWRASAAIICPLLRMHIEDREENIFILNHSPCSEFMKTLREVFPLSKTIFVVHDQGWCAPLLGDEKLLSDILEHNISNRVSSQTIKFVRDYCEEEKNIYSLSDAVVCLSSETYHIITNIYNINASKVYLIPNGILGTEWQKTCMTKEDIREKLCVHRGTKLVLFAGRPAKYKGIEALFMSIRMLQHKYTDFRLVVCSALAGFSEYEHLISPISASLIFTGHLTKEQLQLWYRASDVGIISSYSEQCSYTALEMMDAQLPIIASNGNGMRSMFTDGSNAFIANIGKDVFNTPEYAKSISITIRTALKARQTTFDRYNNYSRELLNTKFSATRMIDSYCKLLEFL